MSTNLYGSPAEQLQAHFYAWERRGRGWDIFPLPVELEPPFRPFSGHYVWQPPLVDDGRKAGLWRSLFGPKTETPTVFPPPANLDPEEPKATVTTPPSALFEHRIILPPDFALPPQVFEQLLTAFRHLHEPLSFELVATETAIHLLVTTRPEDTSHVLGLIRAFVPQVSIIPESHFLESLIEPEHGDLLVVDLGLSEEFMRPIRTLKSFPIDPYVSVVAALSQLGKSELAMVQILFEPAVSPWYDSILRAVHDEEGNPFFLTGAQGVNQAREKVSKPLFAVRPRFAVRAQTHRRRLELLRSLLGSFSQFEQAGSNELIALDSQGWDAQAQAADLKLRSAHRTGMLLNAEELAALVHLPGREVASPKLLRLSRRTKEAPPEVCGKGLLLGVNEHQGKRLPVRVSESHRFRHSYIIGSTGTGKSTLLLNLIVQDLEAGRGLAVLDPHGDLVDAVLARIPEHRVADVAILDPADEKHPVGFNILSAHTELERTLLSSDLVAVFRRLSTSWGDQMTAVLGNAVLAFLESSEGGTLLDLRRFLVDASFRGSFLHTVQDPEVVYFWLHEFPLLRGHPQAPLLTRLDQFLRPKLIRNMVGQKRSALDFRRLMDERKVLLCKLSRGAIGEENAYLLGALLVAKLQQTASSRQDVSEENRPGFFLYLDEFQHFITPSVSDLLTGVRKYRMGLILAHQHLSQLTSRSPELTDAVMSAATRICFQLGDDDARLLSRGFASFEASDLQNLGVGEAVVRIARAESDFNLRTTPPQEVEPELVCRRTEEVIASSREQFAARKEALPEQGPEIRVAPEPKRTENRGSEPNPTTRQPTKSKTTPSTTEHQPGKGGAQHKYLQGLIRRFGEDRGFRTTIERAVLDGYGSVDVALEQGERRIAFEIRVTTPVAHELQNIQKCLAAGFDPVVLVSTDPKVLKRVRRSLEGALPDSELARVRCLTPEEIPAFLDSVVPPKPSSEVVAGFKVDIDYASSGDEDTQGRMDRIRDIVARSLRRNKPSG